MSRSRRKPIIKDGGFGSEYWRTIRRVWKHQIRKIPRNVVSWISVDDNEIDFLDSVDLPHQRSIVNDYDYCDYIFRDCGIEYTRK